MRCNHDTDPCLGCIHPVLSMKRRRSSPAQWTAPHKRCTVTPGAGCQLAGRRRQAARPAWWLPRLVLRPAQRRVRPVRLIISSSSSAECGAMTRLVPPRRQQLRSASGAKGSCLFFAV